MIILFDIKKIFSDEIWGLYKIAMDNNENSDKSIHIFICWSDISPKELGACQAMASIWLYSIPHVCARIFLMQLIDIPEWHDGDK